MTPDVTFVRIPSQPTAMQVTEVLAALYEEGWRVVSHTDADSGYTFVLERALDWNKD